MLYDTKTLQDGSMQLVSECAHAGHIYLLSIRVRGDFILVADLMKSVTLLVYKQPEGVIEEIATDQHPNWMTAAELIDEDTYLGFEANFNMFLCKRNIDAAEPGRKTLEQAGEFHLGDQVNAVAPGSLAMRTKDAAADGLAAVAAASSFLFCTASGAVGTVFLLPRADFEFLEKVQTKARAMIGGIGGLAHESWRTFKAERRVHPPRGVIDGDLIEAVLELPAAKVAEIVGGTSPLTRTEDGTQAAVSAEALVGCLDDCSRDKIEREVLTLSRRGSH